jgi:hypothetical protein
MAMIPEIVPAKPWRTTSQEGCHVREGKGSRLTGIVAVEDTTKGSKGREGHRDGHRAALDTTTVSSRRLKHERKEGASARAKALLAKAIRLRATHHVELVERGGGVFAKGGEGRRGALEAWRRREWRKRRVGDGGSRGARGVTFIAFRPRRGNPDEPAGGSGEGLSCDRSGPQQHEPPGKTLGSA